ncbi:GAF and ANTAR domain-containing protein [Kribbella qitaiheensis]|uniref:GAF and ANTAR domain-containing protein n=1 Tax=Kribbella qitaiheensis TaxID=1544730 RepID=UPI00162583DA|nr:GAF and ANTAR domain-containing protein [Kribbella qitaiheensis]
MVDVIARACADPAATATKAEAGGGGGLRRQLARSTYLYSTRCMADTDRSSRGPATARMAESTEVARQQRSAVALVRCGDHMVGDVADLLGLPVTAVAVLLSSGLRDLEAADRRAVDDGRQRRRTGPAGVTIANPDPDPVAPSVESQLPTATKFAALAVDLAATRDLDQVLAKVLRFAMADVHCDSATIRLQPTGRWPAIMVTSDPPDAQASLLQPTGGHEETGAGVRSVQVVELAVGQTVLGAIAFYAAQSTRFTPADTATAKLLAVHAALAIASVRSAVNLSEAIDSRALIGQAQGIVMERLEVDGEEAFALLRRCSQDDNRKLRDIAHDLVITRRLPGEQLRPGPGRRS